MFLSKESHDLNMTVNSFDAKALVRFLSRKSVTFAFLVGPEVMLLSLIVHTTQKAYDLSINNMF